MQNTPQPASARVPGPDRPPLHDLHPAADGSRRQFLEDLLTVMGDAQVIDLGDGIEVRRDDIVAALAEELKP